MAQVLEGALLQRLGDEVIDAVLARDGDDLPNVSLQAYGGAIAEIADELTAFSGRDTAFEFVAAARWQDPAEDDRRIMAARRYAATMDRFANGVYVNALADEGMAGVRRAYSEAKLERLAAVKHALRSRQRVPSQPEHQTVGRLRVGGDLRRRCGRARACRSSR